MNQSPHSSDDLNPYNSPRTKCEGAIPPPGMDGSRICRVRFLPLELLFVLIAAIFSVAFTVDVFSDGSGTPFYNVLFSLLATVTFFGGSTTFAYVLWHILRVNISDQGIRCANFWGRHPFVPWTDVTDVKSINLLGLRYFRIYGRGLCWPLWLPRFMARPKVFWPFLLTLIEPSSPLAKAIHDAGLASPASRIAQKPEWGSDREFQ